MGSAVEVSGRKAVEQGIANLGVDGASSEQEDDDSSGSPESCMTSSLTEAEAHSCFEKLRAYLYTNGRNGEFSETLYLLSKSVHSFTHETQEKRRAKRGGRYRQLFEMCGRRSGFESFAVVPCRAAVDLGQLSA